MGCLFIYVITFILFDHESTNVSRTYLAFSGVLKNFGISIFFIISSFLLTAHGLREYKYNESFKLKNFYYRRLLRLVPMLIISLLFYFIVHPLLIEFLKLTPLIGGSAFKKLFLLPQHSESINREVLIYLYFIYGTFVLLQFYFLWGLVLKFAKDKINYVLIILLIIGLAVKYIASAEYHSLYLYLPHYFAETSIGAFIAVLARENSPIISKIKLMSGTGIFAVYTVGICTALVTYLLFDSVAFKLAVKLLIYCLVGFYILEQTYAKHSIFKVRNSLFIIQFGNLSYSFLMLLPIISIVTLIAFESIEISVNSKLIILAYPLICLIFTWIASYFFYHYVDLFFKQIRKEYR